TETSRDLTPAVVGWDIPHFDWLNQAYDCDSLKNIHSEWWRLHRNVIGQDFVSSDWPNEEFDYDWLDDAQPYGLRSDRV
ncbi:hypothetical protein chiPu_0024858, partial [Chiloscyllium punctatum]|nr:hypothetical protein [Chiloscyllium punctatum]